MQELQEDITEIKVTLGRHTLILERNTEDLARHIMRTDLLQTLVTDIVNLHRALKIIAVSAVGLVGFIATILGIYKILVP